MSNLVARVKLWWHLLTVESATVKAPAPTVPAPASEPRLIPAPPRVPWEFGLYEASGFDPDADPLRDSFPLRPEK